MSQISLSSPLNLTRQKVEAKKTPPIVLHALFMHLLSLRVERQQFLHWHEMFSEMRLPLHFHFADI